MQSFTMWVCVELSFERVRIVIADAAKAVACYTDSHVVLFAGNQVRACLRFCAVTLTAYAIKGKSQAFCKS
jgi:hypothetical protein